MGSETQFRKYIFHTQGLAGFGMEKSINNAASSFLLILLPAFFSFFSFFLPYYMEFISSSIYKVNKFLDLIVLNEDKTFCVT